jgi:spermidine synthase
MADFVFWDVKVTSQADDSEVARFDKVIVRMDSNARDVEIRDASDTQVAKYVADQEMLEEQDEADMHATIGYQGVEILNAYGKNDPQKSLTLELRPHGV